MFFFVLFFFYSFDFLFYILYKGKHLGIQQSLTWQTEEQRNIGRRGNNKNERKRAGSDIHYSLNQSLPHEYKFMNTEMNNKATFSQRIHKNHLDFLTKRC